MTVLIVLKSTDYRDGFLAELAAHDLSARPLEAMPTILIIDGTTVADFPLKGHPAIESIEDDDPKAARVTGTVTLAELPTSGPWPILRHTSRDRPWGNNLKLPWSGDFSCVRNGTGVDIYLVDTGIRATHQEFGGRAEAIDGWTPVYYHGTSCASCAAGQTTGLARGASIFVAAGLRNTDGTGSISEIITALNACLTHYNGRSATNRPAVLSLSFVQYSTNSYATAVDNCLAAGIVVLAAAANDRLALASTSAFPAENPGVIVVGGINMGDGPYDYGTDGTNYGTEVDILAGSQDVMVADYDSDTDYRSGRGTSFGAPHAAGVVACMLQGYQRLTSAAQVQQVGEYLYRQATFGRYKRDPRFEPMTPAIAYLDPGPGPYPPIPTLVAL